jgi:hypothetical protein
MGAKKTIDGYIQDIREYHLQLAEYPDSETLPKKINTRLNAVFNLLDIVIFQAQNEQTPWKSEDIGYSIRSMLRKDDTTPQQVGDYQAYISSPECPGWIPLLIERKGGKKGCEDLYSTLMNSENCARFYREIERFNADKRFTQMVIIAECSLNDFLLYLPPFIGSARNTKHIGASVEARRGKIASLYARGVPVLFAGTRKNAIELYRGLIKQSVIKNYTSILKLDVEPYDDLVYLKTKQARLESELQAINASLLSYSGVMA